MLYTPFVGTIDIQCLITTLNRNNNIGGSFGAWAYKLATRFYLPERNRICSLMLFCYHSSGQFSMGKDILLIESHTTLLYS